MKVYVITENNVIRCVCNSKEKAEKIIKAFEHLVLTATEYRVI